jgi:hypothetical protein
MCALNQLVAFQTEEYRKVVSNSGQMRRKRLNSFKRAAFHPYTKNGITLPICGGFLLK